MKSQAIRKSEAIKKSETIKKSQAVRKTKTNQETSKSIKTKQKEKQSGCVKQSDRKGMVQNSGAVQIQAFNPYQDVAHGFSFLFPKCILGYWMDGFSSFKGENCQPVLWSRPWIDLNIHNKKK